MTPEITVRIPIGCAVTRLLLEMLHPSRAVCEKPQPTMEWFLVPPCEIPQTFAYSILIYIYIYIYCTIHICYHLLLNYFNRIYRWYIDEWCFLVLIRVVSSQSLDSSVGVSSWLRNPNHFFHTPTVQWEIFRILKWRYVSTIFLSSGHILGGYSLKFRPEK